MSIDENKQTARRYFEEARYHPDICDEIFAPVIRFHTLLRTPANQDVESTPESEKAVYAWLDGVWGDWHMTVDEILAEDDRVMVRWTLHGIQQGEFGGLPPTNRPVSYAGINIFRMENGRIAEVWDIWDRLGLWQQLGALPETAEFVARAREAMQQLGGDSQEAQP